ncbi:MAG: HAD-IA family hydrolase, partial [Lachnospiraceae bacterium]|nr:HAD-IA family hydrolase [Lachnospiraceae bacterium]
LEDLTESVNHVMRSFGHAEHSRDAVRGFVGNGVRNLMRRAVPGGEDNPAFEDELKAQIEYYRAHGLGATKPYEGVDEMLDTLRQRGMSIAILSNKEEVAVKNLCAHFFAGRYDLALGNTPSRPRKPDPAILVAAFEQFQAVPSEVLYVGDSETDAKTAENAGIDYILVTWGFRDRELLETFHPKALIDTPGELISYV